MSIRVGVIGVSYRGQVHIPAFKENPRYEVVAVCSGAPERAEAAAHEYHIPRWYTDPRQLINSDVDLISIATPPATHAGLTAAALARQRHVLSEIAFMPTVADARVVMEMLKGAGSVGAAAFALRYKPHLRLVTDMLAQRAIGEPRVMCFEYFAAEMDAGEARPAWMWEADKGGGVLAGYLSHAIDVALQWFGPVAEVEATLTTLDRAQAPAGIPQLADDTGNFTLYFQNGMLGLFRHSAATAWARTGLEVHGTDGSLIIDGFGDDVSVVWKDTELPQTLFPPIQYLEEARGFSGLQGAFTVFLERLAIAVADRQPVPDLPTFEDGLRVTLVIDALRRAARERRRVSVEA